MVRKRLINFPRTLKKMIRDKKGRWIRGIQGYHYYPVSESGCRKLNRLPSQAEMTYVPTSPGISGVWVSLLFSCFFKCFIIIF